MALLHQFKISKGRVTYKSRFLASDSYQSNQENNRIAVSEFGTITMPDPCKNFFQRFLSRFELPSESFVGGMNIRICNQHVHMHTLCYIIYITEIYNYLLSCTARAHRQCQREFCDVQRRFLCEHRNISNAQGGPRDSGVD